jgi:hypothetical protein
VANWLGLGLKRNVFLNTEGAEKMKTTKTKKKVAVKPRMKLGKPGSWEDFLRLRDASIKADPGAFAGFMADRKDEAPQIRLDEEDGDTLAAIDEGIADARAGRMISPEGVRKICTGRNLAEALAKATLSEDEAKAWRRDLKSAQKRLKAPVDKWREKR